MTSLPTPPSSSPSSTRTTKAKAFSTSSPGTKTRAGAVIVRSTPLNTFSPPASTNSSASSSPGIVPVTPPSSPPPKITIKLIITKKDNRNRKRLRTMDEPASEPKPKSKKRKVAATKKKNIPPPPPPPPGNSQVRLSVEDIGVVPFRRESRARNMGLENQAILGWDGNFEEDGEGMEWGNWEGGEMEEFPEFDEEMAMEMIRVMEAKEIEVV